MIEDLLNPLGGTADIDERISKYKNVQIDNESEIKKIISETIKPYFTNRNELYKFSAKRSLSYYLTTNKVNFGRLYDSCLIAFNHPSNPRNFFLWIWETLFEGENYYVNNIEDYLEIDQVNEGNEYL